MPNSAVTALHASLSPARAALADHSRYIMRARDEVARTSAIVDRLRAHLSLASDQLLRAEADFASIDEQQAAAIREAAQNDAEISSVKPLPNAKADTAVENARRVVATARVVLAQSEGDASNARVVLRDVMVTADKVILDVMIEQHGASLERLSRARDELRASETEVFALMTLIGEADHLAPAAPNKIVWLRAAERVREAYTTTVPCVTSQGDVRSAVGRWREVLGRLIGDATANTGN